MRLVHDFFDVKLDKLKDQINRLRLRTNDVYQLDDVWVAKQLFEHLDLPDCRDGKSIEL